MRAELIYNPGSGQTVVRNELKDVITFLGRSGWTVDYCEVTKPAEATERARQAAGEGKQMVIAAGGDGTVSEVAAGLAGTGTVLAVLPVGTTNVWALQMGIPSLNPMLPSTGVIKLLTRLRESITRSFPGDYYRKVLINAAEVMVNGRVVTVDMGEVSGRRFLMWVGIGLDAAISERISLKGKRFSGPLAYLVPTLWTLPRYPSMDVHMTMDGEVIEACSPMIVVSNIRRYGGFVSIGAKARVNDGKLDVCIFQGKGLFTYIRHALKVLLRRHVHDAATVYHQCSQITIDSAQSLPVHTDGDPFTRTPVVIRVLPSVLKVIVPHNAPKNLFV